MQAVCPECNALNPVDNGFCGSCGASLENARVVTGANLAEPRAATTSEEIAYFASDDVLITNSRAVFGSKTYAMANITSVAMTWTNIDRWLGAIAVALGVAVFVYWLGWQWWPGWLFESSDYFTVAVGLILVGGGVLCVVLAKRRYTVQIASASGESEALVSTNGDYVERIVDAVQQAISERARCQHK